jgi:Uri superfamily endonuclease
MKDSGVYALIIKMGKNQTIKIGKLGKIKFSKGFYVYTGSAMNGLQARLSRHKRKVKKLFWHIDYLLASKYTKISEIFVLKTKQRIECKLNKIFAEMHGAKPVRNFGCSDCSCYSHLICFDQSALNQNFLQSLRSIRQT